MSADSHKIILFDGVCNLCNGWVDFVIRRDKGARFRFAALQSESAASLLKGYKIPADEEPSILLLDGDKIHNRSTAVLFIMSGLSFAWPLMMIFWVVPKPIRDFFYGWVARNRYKWFGKRDTCRLPSPSEKERFLV